MATRSHTAGANETTVNLDDVSYDLQSHNPSGDVFAIEYASVWNADEDCVGSQIVKFFGPVYLPEFGEINPRLTPEQTEHIINLLSNCDTVNTDLEWANEQEWSHIASNV